MKDKVNGHNFQELISDYARNDDDRAWFCPYMVMTPLASTWLVEIPYTRKLLDEIIHVTEQSRTGLRRGDTSVLQYFNDVMTLLMA